MLHAIDTVIEALDQAAAGSTSREISAALDVPYETVRVWRSGRIPKAAAHVLSGGVLCAGCGCPAHPVTDRERYAYLLGLYLGDGCLARNGKNSYLLRITMDTAYPAIIEEARQAVVAVSPNGRGGVAYERRSNCANVHASGRFWPVSFRSTARARSTIGRSCCRNGRTTSSPTTLDRSCAVSSNPMDGGG